MGVLETATHMVMQCPSNALHRQAMHDDISEITPFIDPQEYMNVIMGKSIDEWDYENMVPIWEISAKYVNLMYYDTLRSRQGIG